MHEQLARAIEPALRDATRCGVPCPSVVDDDWLQEPNLAAAMLGGTSGVSVELDIAQPEQVAILADRVQEWVIEELWGSRPTNWPPCPLHPGSHPLKATVMAGAAMWACPKDHLPIASIGSLPAEPA